MRYKKLVHYRTWAVYGMPISLFIKYSFPKTKKRRKKRKKKKSIKPKQDLSEWRRSRRDWIERRKILGFGTDFMDQVFFSVLERDLWVWERERGERKEIPFLGIRIHEKWPVMSEWMNCIKVKWSEANRAV